MRSGRSDREASWFETLASLAPHHEEFFFYFLILRSAPELVEGARLEG
jgi:hypothetical protein